MAHIISIKNIPNPATANLFLRKYLHISDIFISFPFQDELEGQQ